MFFIIIKLYNPRNNVSRFESHSVSPTRGGYSEEFAEILV